MTDDLLRARFVGTWELECGEVWRPDGRLAVTLDRGLLCYSGTGHVAAQCSMASTSADPEILAALGDYLAYFGSWEIAPDTPTILHRVTGCNARSYEGRVLARRFEFVDPDDRDDQVERLVLHADIANQSSAPGGTSSTIVWRRAASIPRARRSS